MYGGTQIIVAGLGRRYMLVVLSDVVVGEEGTRRLGKGRGTKDK